MARRGTWLDRATIPELLGPDEDPGLRRGQGEFIQPTGGAYETLVGTTIPGQRPVVYQDAVNLSLTVTDVPQSIMQGQFPADGVIFSIEQDDANVPAYWGYGSGISSASGIIIPVGQPVFAGPENVRELWELQRVEELMAGIMARSVGMSPLPAYKAPRVAWDLSKFYLVCATGESQVVGVMAFRIPEGQ